MKVLHVHSGNMFGGIERMLETLAPAIAGVAPVGSTFALCFGGAVAHRLRAAGATVHVLGAVHARQLSEIRQARRALAGVLQPEAWDAVLVHSAWSQAIFGPTILNSRVPLVRWLHAPQPGPRVLEFWARRSRPALVLCNSQYTADHGRAQIAGVPHVVQYPPSVMRARRPDVRVKVRGSLATPLDTTVVVLAARLEAGKGHSLLIEALAGLPDRSWEAWIVGGAQHADEQTYLDGLRALAGAAGLSGRIRFLGQRTDVAELFEAADVYCQPNVAPDSFGLSFIEALAAGLPVVTARLGAAPEIVDSTCGTLVPAGSAPALTAALARLIERADERRTLSAGARARARKFCDVPASLFQLAGQLAHLQTRVPALI
ncbi:MAG: glycosyltransferase family 4 protein [Acidobacteriota bacterium]|nr:glycosyltransferase family 4 protein [Acidobacteriota bacterium]